MHPRLLTLIAFLVLFSLPTVNGSVQRSWKDQQRQNTFSNPLIDISVFPNPSSGRVSVEIKQLEKPVTMNLFDIIGNKVYGLEIRSKLLHQLDLSHLQKGYYMAHFTDGSGLVETRRIQIR